MKSLFSVFALGLVFFLTGLGVTISFSGTAHAQTINCTGAGADTSTNNTEVIFSYNAANPGASTCVINDNFSVATTNEGDFIFRLQIQTNGPEFFDFRTTAGAAVRDDHSVCNIGSTVIANGVNCQAALGADGVTTARVTYAISDGTTIAFTSDLNAVATTNIDITAASVTITVPGGAGTTPPGPGTGKRALVAATGTTQTRDTLRNVQKHIDVLTGGGLQGSSSSGAPSGAPSGGAGGTTDGSEAESQFAALGFDSVTFDTSSESRDSGTGTNDFRQLAIAMAPRLQFDTARGDFLGTSSPGGDRLYQTDGAATEAIPQAPVGDIVRGALDTNIWLFSSYSRIKNTRNNTGDDQRFDGDSLTVSAGADYRFDNGVVVGTALSYSSTELTTQFNDGSYSESAYTISPYVVWQATDWLATNASLGYTYSPIDQTEQESTNFTESDTTGNTVFLSVNAKASENFGDLRVSVFTGATGMYRRIDGFTDSAGTVSQHATTISREVKVGGEAGYTFAAGDQFFFPYVTAEYQIELGDEVNNDQTASELGGGLRWEDSALRLAASIEGTVLVGRDDYEQFNIRGIVSRSYDSDVLLGTLSPSFGLQAGASQTGLSTSVGETVATEQSFMSVGVGYAHKTRPLTIDLSAREHGVMTPDADARPTQFRMDLRFQF